MRFNKRFFITEPKSLLSLPVALKIKDYTMVAFEDMYHTDMLLDDLQNRKIFGAVVETGCWRGGMGAAMARFGRKTWLFDSFEGLPEMSELDSDITKPRELKHGVRTGYLKTSEKDPHEAASLLGVKVNVVKGWFEDTLVKYKEKIGPIALLRLDGDTYESTKVALEVFYESVVSEGYIIFDDFDSFSGCRKAVYEFLGNLAHPASVQHFPTGKVYIKK